jgi:hypothetical protein
LVSTQLERFPRIISSKITVEQGKLTARIRLKPDQALQDSEDEQMLFVDIKEFLRHSLPYYMIPQAFFVSKNSNKSITKTSPSFQLHQVTSLVQSEDPGQAKDEKQNYKNRTNSSFFGSLRCCYGSRAVVG